MIAPRGADLDGHLPGSGPWILGMRWTDLLFAHWRITPLQARQLVPPPLEPDLHDGWGWIGVVPFRMSRVRPRAMPPVPPISRFPELNVRTYATFGGRRGVWFLSLDAAGRVACRFGRDVAGLPYHHAAMEMRVQPDGPIVYRSRRRAAASAPAELLARYQPVGPVRAPSPVESFLTERDGLWTIGRDGRPRWLAIRHEAWPLQDAVVEIQHQSMTLASGIALPGPPDHVAFSRRVDVVAWRPMTIPAAGTPG